jgi:uncharacterized protein (TIGR02453 family)
MTDGFAGFPKDFFAFFRELKVNNERAWFEENKTRFRESVQAPMSDFIAAMAPRLAKVSKQFTADPRPNGGSMFRIYRDVRFSRDKRLYKEHAACHFRHALGKDAHAPGFYVHVAPDDVMFGGGLWMPPPDALAKIRAAIAEKPQAWKKVLGDAKFRDQFGSVQGEQLSRPPRGFDAANPFIDDIRRKSFFAMRHGTVKLASSPGFVDAVADAFGAAKPLLKFLCDAVDVSF